MSLVTLAHPDEAVVIERGVLEMHSPVFKEMLAECAGGGDTTVPLVDDTLEGAKAFVKLCKIGVGEDATELKSITPRLLADALPLVHKYAAVGLGKIAHDWFGHIVETMSTPRTRGVGTSHFRGDKHVKSKYLDDLSECFAILDNLFQAEWTPADIQWITGNTLGNIKPKGSNRGLQPHVDPKVLESLTQRTLIKMMIQMNKHNAPKDQPISLKDQQVFCVRDGAREFVR
jgi:hypothetical protein